MGGFAGAIDPSFTESAMVIDYVRVYQNQLSTDEVSINDFKVYPNPATDYITISSQHNIDAVEIYNTLGQSIFRKEQDVNTINVQDIESGIYLLKIYSGKSSVSKKIVVN